MKPLTVVNTGLACILVPGLIAVLAHLVHQGGAALPQPVVPGAAQAAPIVAAPAALAPSPGYWVFSLNATAIDDPHSARTVKATIIFRGAAQSCNVEHLPTVSGVGVDRTGARAVVAKRAREVCVPACDGPPPAVQTQPLRRKLEMTAYQAQFDQAQGEYAPEGRISWVQWQCNGRSHRLVAASLVALACSSAECDDRQVANAAVYLARDGGRELDPVQALFPLRGTAAGPIFGQAVPAGL